MRRGRIAMLGESVRMSFSNIVQNRMRSFLTMLGIIIGVMAIITLITVVEGATNQVLAEFNALGTGTLTVSANGTPLKSGLSEEDLESLRALDNVAGIAPTISLSSSAKSENGFEESASLYGRSAEYFRKNSDMVTRGRALNQLDMDGENLVCLIDGEMQEKLFFGEDPLGQSIYIGARRFTVVGVLGQSTNVMMQTMGMGDGMLVIPYTTAMKLSGSRHVNSLEVYVENTDEMDAVVEDVERVLNEAFNYKDNSFQVINLSSLLDTMDRMMSMMSTLLASIASIALLVGGIGIMNMMLVSVTERTTEIGLRKALGAEPGVIQMQFLIESILLSLLGGLLGILLGVAVSYVFSVAMGMDFMISWSAIALAGGFSAAVGILFGWAPARKASNLNPIDALRSV